MYETGDISNVFKVKNTITVPKKVGSHKCQNYRTISLTTHASEILTTIIYRIVEQTIESSLDKDQFGFRKGRGTREALFSLRLTQNCRLPVGKFTYLVWDSADQYPLNSKLHSFPTSHDPGIALVLNFRVTLNRCSTPSIGVLTYCLLGFMRGLSKNFYSGLPPEKSCNALSVRYGRPRPYSVLHCRGSTVVSSCRIMQRAPACRTSSNSCFGLGPGSLPPCGQNQGSDLCLSSVGPCMRSTRS